MTFGIPVKWHWLEWENAMRRFDPVTQEPPASDLLTEQNPGPQYKRGRKFD